MVEHQVWKKNSYTITTKKTDLNIGLIFKILSQSYWAKERTIEQIRGSIDNSYCFGLYDNDQQVGFGRVITDKFTFAYLADVFVVANYQGKGLGKWLIATILKDKTFAQVGKWYLLTKDAHTLYEKFEFEALTYPERIMSRKINFKSQSEL